MAARIGSLISIVALFGISSLSKVEGQQVIHVDVHESLFGELRRLDESQEEEVGHEVANEVFIAQNQQKKATTITNLESYNSDQTQAVDQSRAIIEDPNAEKKPTEEVNETVQDEVKKEVLLDENGEPILTEEELKAKEQAEKDKKELSAEELADYNEQLRIQRENRKIEEGFDEYAQMDAEAES